jgi:hypothetical protein
MKPSPAIRAIDICCLATEYANKLKKKGHREKYIAKKFPMILEVCAEIVDNAIKEKK